MVKCRAVAQIEVRRRVLRSNERNTVDIITETQPLEKSQFSRRSRTLERGARGQLRGKVRHERGCRRSDENHPREQKDHSGKGTHNSFFFTPQWDFARNGASVRCNGCQYILGRIPYQVAYTTDCRKSIVNMMRGDPEYRLRVQKWDENHGISEKGRLRV